MFANLIRNDKLGGLKLFQSGSFESHRNQSRLRSRPSNKMTLAQQSILKTLIDSQKSTKRVKPVYQHKNRLQRMDESIVYLPDPPADVKSSTIEVREQLQEAHPYENLKPTLLEPQLQLSAEHRASAPRLKLPLNNVETSRLCKPKLVGVHSAHTFTTYQQTTQSKLSKTHRPATAAAVPYSAIKSSHRRLVSNLGPKSTSTTDFQTQVMSQMDSISQLRSDLIKSGVPITSIKT